MSNFASSMRASCRPRCIAARPGPPKTPPVERLYNKCSKTLLNVRNMTSNELYYAELGLPPALVLQRQRQFVQSLWRQRALIDDDPWAHAMRIAIAAYNGHLEELLT